MGPAVSAGPIVLHYNDDLVRVKSSEPITVVVGRFGSAFGRGLLQILEEDAGLQVVDAGLDRAGLEAKVSRGGIQVVVLDEDSSHSR
jgi:hypothetical protein